ncbi:4Fe4S-binding leucine-rich repeat protein [Ideonella sp. A 288]|uniref:4Fe4S-binding leucine-rich repeat protein n=1 Tax=Ideonella sp. A 288 TaxID=1962181 RepID=UPI001F31C8C3|nr:4Fe4S-binding leucine-rich repeat protein [Ideonella sp. A 288]
MPPDAAMDTPAPAAATLPDGSGSRSPAWDDIPARDWQGRAIDCTACAHHVLRARSADDGGCEPGRCCMQDAYARRIDRFFRRHPTLAGAHLQHPYFEVRAIAARHVELFSLPALMDDPDETVRLQVALRLPQRLLARMRQDPHREVRLRVAWRLAEAELPALLGDVDEAVRLVVARRIAPPLLAALMHDPDRQVRGEVALRLPMPALLGLVADPAPEVRRVVAERLPAPLLDALSHDTDWTVRWTVAGRAQGALLQRLLRDDEPDVRERAAQRQDELEASHG